MRTVPQRGHTLLLALCAGTVLCAVQSASASVLADNPALTAAASVYPSTVEAYGPLDYEVTIAHSATAASSVSVAHTLPEGFTYVGGSARLVVDGVERDAAAPVQSGQTLTWSGLPLPAARLSSNYGMHTFVQDRCDKTYIGFQLDRVRELMGPGAFAKQLFYNIGLATSGPQACWIDFVNGCYDRQLVPVVRLQGSYGGEYWLKPPANAPGDYSSIAQAYARVVSGLPRRAGAKLYVEIWNEPNLNIEWNGQANPVEYAQFLKAVAAAIRGLHDNRLVILNGALSPSGNYGNLAFIDGMASVPGALASMDIWAAHPYPGNHPPSYNIHDGTAPLFPELTIDSYLLELQRLAAHGRLDLPVLLTETGYALGQNNFGFQGFAPIDETNRASYIALAFRDYWSRWAEVVGVCPYELVDPYGNWGDWDWLYRDGRRHAQYDSVLAVDKTPRLATGRISLRFKALAGGRAGTFPSQITVRPATGSAVTLGNAAPVLVRAPIATLTPTSRPSPSITPTPTATGQVVCHDLLIDGGFEQTDGWVFPSTAYPAGYSQAVVRSGTSSLRVGIEQGMAVNSYSSARQAFVVPAAASSVIIRFWYYATSSDTANDRQYALLLDQSEQYLATAMWVGVNAPRWQQWEYRLTGHRGETIWLQFGALNDAIGGTAAMYVDDAEIKVCLPFDVVTATPTATAQPTQAATPTGQPTMQPTPSAPGPTLTPSPTVSPSPTLPRACTELVTNGGFEGNGGWVINQTSYPARYTSQQSHYGGRSMLLGIDGASSNQYSYSSVEQTLTIPHLPTVQLSFWYYPASGDAEGDSQYVLAVQDSGQFQALMWIVSDARMWVHKTVDMAPYASQEITLRFGVLNDGREGVTWMNVDDVSIIGCQDLPTLTPTLTMTPRPTPSTTPVVLPTATRAHPDVPAYVLQTIAVGRSPRGVAVDTRDGRVYIANYLGGDISVVDAALGRVVASIPLPGTAGCLGLAIDSQLGRAYVCGSQSRDLVAVDLDQRTVAGQLALDTSPLAVVADPTNGRVHVAGDLPARLVAIDGPPLAQLRAEPLLASPRGLLLAAVGQLAVTQVTSPTGLLSIMPLAGGAHVADAPLGASPAGIARDPLSGKFYVADAVEPRISILAPSGALMGTIEVDTPIQQIVYNPNTEHLLAISEQTRSAYIISADSGTTHLVLPVGRGAHGIAIDYQTGRVYVSNADDNTVTVIQDVPRSALAFLPAILKLGSGEPLAVHDATASPLTDSGGEGLHQDLRQPARGLSSVPLITGDGAPLRLGVLAVDDRRRRVYLASPEGLLALDAVTGYPLLQVESLLAGGQQNANDERPRPVAIAVAQPDGTVYTAWSDGTLVAIDAGGQQTGSVGDLGLVTAIEMTQDALLVADAAGERLVVLQPRTCEVIGQLALDGRPLACRYAAELDRVFVAVGRPRPDPSVPGWETSASLAIVALKAASLEPVARTEFSGLGYPITLALDEPQRRLYAAYQFSPKWGTIACLDADTLTTLVRRDGNYVNSLAEARLAGVDRASGLVAAAGHRLLRLGRDTLSIDATLDLGPDGTAQAVGWDATESDAYLLLPSGELVRWAPDAP